MKYVALVSLSMCAFSEEIHSQEVVEGNWLVGLKLKMGIWNLRSKYVQKHGRTVRYLVDKKFYYWNLE